MKVTIPKEMMSVLTLSDMPTVRKMIKDFKEDETTAFEYASVVARLFGFLEKVFEAKATIAKNSRVWNAYTDESGTLDIWIEFTAQLYGEKSMVIMIGVYLTDIWSITGQPQHDEPLKKHMYVRKFIEE